MPSTTLTQNQWTQIYIGGSSTVDQQFQVTGGKALISLGTPSDATTAIDSAAFDDKLIYVPAATSVFARPNGVTGATVTWGNYGGGASAAGYELATAALEGNGVIGKPLLGAIGCRGAVGDTTTNTFRKVMSRVVEVARDDATFLSFVDANFYATQTAEDTAQFGTLMLSRVVRYKGQILRVTWGGFPTSAIPIGMYGVSDALPISVKRGDQIVIDTYAQSNANASGRVPMSNYFYAAAGEMTSFDAAETDKTGTDWTPISGGQTQIYRHVTMLSTTRRPSVVVIGDSRADQAARPAPFWWAGELAAIHAAFGTINVARASQTLAQFLANPLRQQVLQYATHVVIQGGTNDLAAGQTAEQVIALRQSIRALAPGLKWLHTTIGPRVTGTYATLAGQTPVASEAERLRFNAMVRGGVSGFDGYFDTADAIESSRDSGKWRLLASGSGEAAVATTGDGLHALAIGWPLFAPAVDLRLIRATA